MCQRAGETIVSLLHVAGLPVTLTQGTPSLAQGGVVLDGLRETLFCFSAVLCGNIQSSPLQTPELNFGQRVLERVEKRDCFFHLLLHILSLLPCLPNVVEVEVVCIEVIQIRNSCLVEAKKKIAMRGFM